MTALLLAALPQLLTILIGFGAAKLHTLLGKQSATTQAAAAQVSIALVDALKNSVPAPTDAAK